MKFKLRERTQAVLYECNVGIKLARLKLHEGVRPSEHRRLGKDLVVEVTVCHTPTMIQRSRQKKIAWDDSVLVRHMLIPKEPFIQENKVAMVSAQ